VNNARKDPKEKSFPGDWVETVEISCQRDKQKKEKGARKNRTDRDVIGAHAKNSTPGNDRVGSKENS
jgi:hypothetical protein